jgi:hypothetical protein
MGTSIPYLTSQGFFFFLVKGFPQNFGKLSSSRLVVGVEWGHHMDRFEAGNYEFDVFTVNLMMIFQDKYFFWSNFIDF